MFQQNANEGSFVCVTNSESNLHLFHKKVISQDPLQKIYPNLARTYKNIFHENKIKPNWLNLLKKFYYSLTDSGKGKKAPLPSCQIGLTINKNKKSKFTFVRKK